MSESLICGNCNKSFEIETGPRGSALIEAILWITLFIPGVLYGMWRRRKPKKKCDYCGSDFILPDSPANRKFLKWSPKNPRLNFKS
jgi:hypothetical protein